MEDHIYILIIPILIIEKENKTMFSFVKRIKGKQERLSITVPKQIIDDYGVLPGDYVKVTLKRTPKDTESIQFAKKLAKCGSEGVLIYIPKNIAQKYNLERDMSFWITVQYIEEIV